MGSPHQQHSVPAVCGVMWFLFISGITAAESHKTRITPHNAARTATGAASTGNAGARREQRPGSRRVPELLRGCPRGKRSAPGEPEATQPADSSRRVAFEAEGVPSPAELFLRRHRDRQATSADGGVVNGQDPRRALPLRHRPAAWARRAGTDSTDRTPAEPCHCVCRRGVPTIPAGRARWGLVDVSVARRGRVRDERHSGCRRRMPARRGLAVSLTFADITAGIRLAGVVPNAAVTVAAPQVHGPESATLTYRTAEGNVAQRLISASCRTQPCTAIMCARPAPGTGGLGSTAPATPRLAMAEAQRRGSSRGPASARWQHGTTRRVPLPHRKRRAGLAGRSAGLGRMRCSRAAAVVDWSHHGCVARGELSGREKGMGSEDR